MSSIRRVHRLHPRRRSLPSASMRHGQLATVSTARSRSSPAPAAGSAGRSCTRSRPRAPHVVAADVEPAALVETAAKRSRSHHDRVDRRQPRSKTSPRSPTTRSQTFGAVDVLCNNAGVFAGGLIWERPVERLRVDARRQPLGHPARDPRVRPADARTRQRPAHIVNTVSMAGLCATPFTAPYNVSKFAALAATECLAHDLAAVGAPIGVSVVVPSAVATRIGESGRNRPGRRSPAPTSDDAALRRAGARRPHESATASRSRTRSRR